MHDLLRGHLPANTEVVAARRECRVHLAAADQARRHAGCADAVTAIDAARRKSQVQRGGRLHFFDGGLRAVRPYNWCCVWRDRRGRTRR
ncbi:hypothetical protein D3C73_947140 [compost metagenome]